MQNNANSKDHCLLCGTPNEQQVSVCVSFLSNAHEGLHCSPLGDAEAERRLCCRFMSLNAHNHTRTAPEASICIIPKGPTDEACPDHIAACSSLKPQPHGLLYTLPLLFQRCSDLVRWRLLAVCPSAPSFLVFLGSFVCSLPPPCSHVGGVFCLRSGRWSERGFRCCLFPRPGARSPAAAPSVLICGSCCDAW